MLDTEPLSRLLEEKWKRFAGGMFFLNFLFYLAYLIIFTIWAYNKQNGKVSSRCIAVLCIPSTKYYSDLSDVVPSIHSHLLR